MTDPGPFTAAPEGSLIEAQNVVVLRPGVIEPRPGAAYQRDAFLEAGGYTVEAFGTGNPNDGGFTVAGTSGFAPWVIRNLGSTVTGPTSFIQGCARFAQTGGRLLLTSQNGVCTMPGQLASPGVGSGSIAYRAGMPQPFAPQFVTATAPTGYPAGAAWLPNGDSVAYRVTLRRTLANGTIVESAPSCRCVVTNGAGAARGIALWGVVPIEVYYAWAPDGVGAGTFNSLMAGDELCIYRSARITGTPSDEMRLRAVLPYDTTYNGFTTIVNGIATPWFDGLDDSAWTGAALYTNSTQEGAAFANYRPEYARDIALYKGITFYAGARSPQRVDMTLKLSGTAATVTDPQNAMCTFVFTGNTTIGTNTIVGCTNIRYFSIGQQLGSAADPNAVTQFPAGTEVTAINIGAATVTVNANATATVVGAGFVAWDWIESSDANTRTFHYNGAGGGGAPATARYWDITAQSLDARWNGTFETNIQLRCTGATPTTEIVCSWFRPDCTDAAFTITSSKPFAWSRYVAPGLGVDSATIGGVAELQWSKVGEPEHCPIPYRTTVGDASKAIRRIIQARQSLLIFKDDGLFQCFGDSPDELIFEPMDSTILLPNMSLSGDGVDNPSKWVSRIDDRVFAMTTRGPMSITDAGAANIGAPVMESMRETVGFFTDAYVTRSIMVDPSTQRVGFFYSESSAIGYVVDASTGIWTTWTFPWPVAAWYLTAGNAPGFAGGTRVGALRDLRVNVGPVRTGWPASYDENVGQTFTINSVTGTGPYTITIAAGSQWIPAVGDTFTWTAGAVGTRTVTAVTSATVFQTDVNPSIVTPLANVRWHEAFECRVIWLASEGNPATEKLWRSMALPLEKSDLIARMKWYFRGYRNTGAAEEGFFVSPPTNPFTDPGYPALIPAFVRAAPVGHARDWALRAGFTIKQADCWFSTSGISLLYENLEPDKAVR